MDVELLIDAVGFTEAGRIPSILLKERDGERYLRLDMGQAELYAIVQSLEKISVERPTTHDLLAAVIRDAGIEPVSVRLEPWRDGVFRAVFTGVLRGEPFVCDCRPSDAVALALRLGIPVRAAPALIRRFGLVESDGENLRLEALGPDAFGDFVM